MPAVLHFNRHMREGGVHMNFLQSQSTSVFRKSETHVMFECNPATLTNEINLSINFFQRLLSNGLRNKHLNHSCTLRSMRLGPSI